MKRTAATILTALTLTLISSPAHATHRPVKQPHVSHFCGRPIPGHKPAVCLPVVIGEPVKHEFPPGTFIGHVNPGPMLPR